MGRPTVRGKKVSNLLATPAIVDASITSRDITLQKQAELEIRKAIEQRDQFLATLSHEL